MRYRMASRVTCIMHQDCERWPKIGRYMYCMVLVLTAEENGRGSSCWARHEHKKLAL